MTTGNAKVSDTHLATRLEFQTDDNMVIAAQAWGHPEDRPIIFAHGGGQTRHAWGETARLMAEQGWYGITIDMRGHGDSQWCADGDYSLDAFASDLKSIAKQLHQKPIAVGASLGGLSSILAEGESEDSILAALILVDITGKMNRAGVSRVISFMSDNMEDGFASLTEAADAIARYNPNRPRPKNLEGLSKNLRLHKDGRYRWHWDPLFLTSPRRPAAGKYAKRLEIATTNLTLPTLLVRGQMSDLITEEIAQEFLTAVPHAHYTDVKNAGHMIAGDKNDIFSKAVIDFLEQLHI